MDKISTGVLMAGLVLASLPGFGQACSKTLGANENYSAASGDVVCIASGVTYVGTLTIAQNNVTVVNNGTISGTIQVNSGVSGTAINNLNSISTNNLLLNAPTALNNGSSVVASASWGGYVTGVAAAPSISNYGTWTAQLAPLPGGTVINRSTGVWNVYTPVSAPVSITNLGTWQGQVSGSTGSTIISIAQNGGTWTGGVGDGSGSLQITVNAAGWSKGFNFPGGSSNSFTTAAGVTASLDSYLGISGTVTFTNNGTLNLTSGMASLPGGSSLTTGAGSNFNVSGGFTNNGTVLNRGTITSANFTNSGTITGPPAAPRGRFSASGYTVNSGSFGADGSYLDFCDGTPPTPASNGFDSPGGTVGANVTYCAPAAPLPVVLVGFEARRQGGRVLLGWTTASEQENEYFAVERSADGRGFEEMSRVAGQGSKASATTYAAADAAPLPGLSYYRLRQVDRGGQATYSPVLSVAAAEATVPPAYPNPTADQLTLDLRALPDAPVAVTVRDLLGRPVLTATLPGGQLHPLVLAALPAGSYLLHLRHAGQPLATQRISKQ